MKKTEKRARQWWVILDKKGKQASFLRKTKKELIALVNLANESLSPERAPFEILNVREVLKSKK